MPRPSTPRSYRLTAELVSAHCGSLAVVALDARAIGQHFPLYADRPGVAYNATLRAEGAPVKWTAEGAPKGKPGPVLTRVEIRGPIAERAGYEDPCGGWTDGHDAIAERSVAALVEGDMLLDITSPGGVVAGGQPAMQAILDAKRKYGRRITGYAHMCGSMATWYALVLCDELFVESLGIVGSIGTLGGHKSIAEMLKKEGVEITEFSAPGAGKLALSPHAPLTELGKSRAIRDIGDCYAAFEADVCASPLGAKLGLTPKVLRKLDSDALIGQRAVTAKLATGVATLEDTIDYALTRAATTEGKTMDEPTDPAKEEEPGAKAEEDEPMPCGKCKALNPGAKKYCGDCGASLAAEEPMPADEEEEPASEPTPAAKTSRAAPRMSADADLVAILGAKGDSLPALKSSALKMRAALDAVAGLVGARGHLDVDGIVEGVALSIDERKAAQVAAKTWRTKAEEQQARLDDRDRMAMLEDLERIGAYKPGELFAHDRKGGKITGKRPATEWSADVEKGGRSLANLRVHHAAKMASAGNVKPAGRNPFEPKVPAKDDAVPEGTEALAAQSGMDSKLLADAARFVDRNLGGAS